MTRDERRTIVWAAAKEFGYQSPQHNRAIQEHMVPNEHGVLVYKHEEPRKPRGMHSERRDAYRQAWREGKLTWDELQAFEDALANEYKAR